MQDFQYLNSIIAKQKTLFVDYDIKIYDLFVQALPEIIHILTVLEKQDAFPIIVYHSWKLEKNDWGLVHFNQPLPLGQEIWQEAFEEIHEAFKKPLKEFLEPLLKIPKHTYNKPEVSLGHFLLTHQQLEQRIKEFEELVLRKMNKNHKEKILTTL